MIDLINKKCTHLGCTTSPSYGVAGTKKPEFCMRHAKQGMGDFRSKKCATRGCSKQASFGANGTKKGEFCAEHAEQGMVMVTSKTTPGWRGAHGRNAATASPKHSRLVSSPPIPDDGGSSITRTTHRIQERQDPDQEDPAPPCTQPTTSRSRAGRGSSGNNQTGGPGAPMGSLVGVQVEDPWSSADDGDDPDTPAVKSEAIVLPSGVVAVHGAAGAGGTVARTAAVERRCKRKGSTSSPSSSSSRENSCATAAAGRSSGRSTGSGARRRGKRARRAIDEDVVVLEDVEPGGMADEEPGTGVSIKPEH